MHTQETNVSDTPVEETPPSARARQVMELATNSSPGLSGEERVDCLLQELREAAFERDHERQVRQRLEERLDALVNQQQIQGEQGPIQETANIEEQHPFGRADPRTVRTPTPAEESAPPTDNTLILRGMEELAEEVSRLRKDKLAGQCGMFTPWVSPFSAHILERGRDLNVKTTKVTRFDGSGDPRMHIDEFRSATDGTSTIGEMLAKETSFSFIDADDFHSKSNKEKMSKGWLKCLPSATLSEEDRIPWLETIRNALRDSLVNGSSVIFGCSALQKRYREVLRSADPSYEPGSYAGVVKFVLLDAEAHVLAARLAKRVAEGKHFMSPELLQSQLDLLNIDV